MKRGGGAKHRKTLLRGGTRRARQKSNRRTQVSPATHLRESDSYFSDPVTMERLRDPVIAADGRTYSRSTITRLAAESGNGRRYKSPFTRQWASVRKTVRPRSPAFREHLQRFDEAHPELNPDYYTPLGNFTYDNLMYPRDTDWSAVDAGAPMPPPIPYNNRTRNVRSIIFPISRSWDVVHKIEFAEPVTKKAAVDAAEAFLSGPFTRELFTSICHRDNWICNDMTFDSVVAERLCIGDLLGDAKVLEGFTMNTNGELHLEIGS